MRPGPVIEAELRQWSRRPWLTWSRVAAAGPLLVLLLGMGTAGGVGVGIGTGSFGTSYFNACVTLATLMAMVFGTLATLDVVARERREGTLDLLFLTPLGSPDILLGKLLASGALVGQVLVAMLPVAAIGFLAGGPTWADLAWAAAGIVNVLFVSMAMGLAASARARHPMSALALGAALGLAVHVGLPWVAHATSWAGWTSVARAVSWLSPVYEVRTWDLGGGWRPASDAWVGLVASHALGWAFIAWAQSNLGRSGSGARHGTSSPRRPRAARGKATWTGEQRVAAVAGATGWIRWLGPMVAWGAVAVLALAWAFGRWATGGAWIPAKDALVFLGFVVAGASLWQRVL
ncbi:MAG: ABC transporter permease [Verrucomicrobiota bacterium]